MTRALALSFLLLVAGCTTHGDLLEATDLGIAHEEAARKLERKREFAPAAARFAAAETDFSEALRIAELRENHVFISFITAKLSIVSSGQGRCVQPDNDPQGSWEQAIEHYRRAADYARTVTLLRMVGDAIMNQAYCRRPDNDPQQGSWKAAGELYAEAAKVYEGFGWDEGRAPALREQALCLMEGRRTDFTPEVRLLLERARKLGDEQAADILTLAGGKSAFCPTCGGDMAEGETFCRRCGQTPPPPAPPREGRSTPRRPPGAEGEQGVVR